MCQEVQNYHLQSWLKRKIKTLPIDQQIKLKNLAQCGRNVLPHNVAIQGQQGVFLLSNGTDSKFFGHITCKNTWACPICTARVMEKRRQRIAAALDALGDKLFAFSVTFTIPHLRYQSCHEVTDILYQTWSRFNNCKSQKGKRANDQFVKPVKEFLSKIQHYVKVAEYTYGENGWHPHFHCIFWTDFETAKSIIEYQPQLEKSWNNIFANVAQNYWKKNNLTRDINKFKNIFAHHNWKATHKLKYSTSVFISTNEDGSLFRVKSSDYIAGWGGDSEATGNRLKKASHDGHLTQWQILELAEHNQKYADLYIEFCLEVSTHVHKRTAFSKNLKQIIDQHIQKVGMESVLKKKSSEEWKVLLWFTKEQWSELCTKNLQYPILSNILFLATKAATNSDWRDTLENYVVAEIGEVCLPDTNILSKIVHDMYNQYKKAA